MKKLIPALLLIFLLENCNLISAHAFSPKNDITGEWIIEDYKITKEWVRPSVGPSYYQYGLYKYKKFVFKRNKFIGQTILNNPTDSCNVTFYLHSDSILFNVCEERKVY